MCLVLDVEVVRMRLSLLVVSIVILSLAQKTIALSFGVLLRGRLWEQRKKILVIAPKSPTSDLHTKYASILGIKSCHDSNIAMLEESMHDDVDEEYDEDESQVVQSFCYNPQISPSASKYSTSEDRGYFWFFITNLLIPIILGVLSYFTAHVLDLSDRCPTYLQCILAGKETKKQRFENPEEYDRYLEEVLLNADSFNALCQHDQAREMIEEAITASYVTQFSKQHDPGTLYHMLSMVESSAGDNLAALNAINNAYEIYENSLGPSIETAYLLEDLSTILTALGRFDDAKAALKRSTLYLETSGRSNDVNDNDKDLLEKQLIEYKQMLMNRAKSMAATGEFSDDEDECSDEDSELEMINNPKLIPPIVQNATQKRETARIMNLLGGIEYMSGDFNVAADIYTKSKEMFTEAKGDFSTIEAVEQNLKASKSASILTAPEFIEMYKSIDSEARVLSTDALASSEPFTTEKENGTHQVEKLNNNDPPESAIFSSETIVTNGKEENKGERISPVGIADADIY